MGKVFVSYRRVENGKDARSLSERLRRDLNQHDVFMDVDSIRPGEDFLGAVDRYLSDCDVLLVLIGRNWLSPENGKDKPRLFDPEDLVRIEIQTALEHNVPIFPVLLDGALPLQAEQLPESLRALVRLQAVSVDDVSFDQDVRALVEVVRGVLASKEAPGKTPRFPWLGIKWAAALAIVAVSVFLLFHMFVPRVEQQGRGTSLNSKNIEDVVLKNVVEMQKKESLTEPLVQVRYNLRELRGQSETERATFDDLQDSFENYGVNKDVNKVHESVNNFIRLYSDRELNQKNLQDFVINVMMLSTRYWEIDQRRTLSLLRFATQQFKQTNTNGGYLGDDDYIVPLVAFKILLLNKIKNGKNFQETMKKSFSQNEIDYLDEQSVSFCSEKRPEQGANIAIAYATLGGIYFSLNGKNMADRLFDKSIFCLNALPSSFVDKSISSSYRELAFYFKKARSYDRAEFYFRKLANLSGGVSPSDYLNIAWFYEDLHDTRKAVYYYDKYYDLSSPSKELCKNISRDLEKSRSLYLSGKYKESIDKISVYSDSYRECESLIGVYENNLANSLSQSWFVDYLDERSSLNDKRLKESFDRYNAQIQYDEWRSKTKDSVSFLNVNNFLVTCFFYSCESISIDEKKLEVNLISFVDDDYFKEDKENLYFGFKYLGLFFHKKQKYSESLFYYGKALHEARELFQGENYHIASIWHGMANVYRDQDEFSKAATLYHNACRVYENSLMPDHYLIKSYQYDQRNFLFYQPRYRNKNHVFSIRENLVDQAEKKNDFLFLFLLENKNTQTPSSLCQI